MSLSFIVSGSNIRTFLSVLLCVGKIGDAVYLVALKDGIELSAVTPSSNGHIAVRIHQRCFDNFTFTPPAPPADATSASSSELFLCLLTKTLMATVLRQHTSNTIQSIEFQYTAAAAHTTAAAAELADEGESNLVNGAATAAVRDSRAVPRAADLDDRVDADVVRWHCTYARNITKTFLLRLADGYPSSVCADATRYHFEVCGEARTYGGLLASLPNSAGQCGLTLLEGGGLELRSVSGSGSSISSSGNGGGGSHSKQQQQSGSSTGAGAAASSSPSSADGSATVVTAFARAFTLFRFFDLIKPAADGGRGTAQGDVAGTQGKENTQQRGEERGASAPDTDASTGPSMVPATPSQSTPQQQQPQAEDGGDGPALSSSLYDQLALKPFVQLPGKVFDVKPFKQAAWLAEQLGVQLQLCCGDVGTPLLFASITPEEVEAEKMADAAVLNAAHGGHNSSGFVATLPVHRAVVAERNASTVPACISFALHVAALDVAASIPASSALSAPHGSGGSAEMNVTTAMSSPVNTPRTSTHLSHATPHPSTENKSAAAVDFVASSLPPSSSSQQQQQQQVQMQQQPSILVSATRSSMTLLSDHSGGPSTATSRGATQISQPAAVAAGSRSFVVDSAEDGVSPSPWTQESHSNSAGPLGTVLTASVSQVDPSFPSSRPSFSNSGEAADVGGRVSGQPFADTPYTTPRPSPSGSLGIEGVVGTAATNPGIDSMMRQGRSDGGGSNGGVGGVLPLAAAPNAASSYTAASLNSMYPLDFEAFARTYTTQQDVDGGEDEEGAQDAELREFLASCVASMSRGPAEK